MPTCSNQARQRGPGDDGRRNDNQRPFNATGEIFGFAVAEGVHLIWRSGRNDQHCERHESRSQIHQ
jgi:hypothetical protein